MTPTDKCYERLINDKALTKVALFMRQRVYDKRTAAKDFYDYLKVVNYKPATLTACQMFMGLRLQRRIEFYNEAQRRARADLEFRMNP